MVTGRRFGIMPAGERRGGSGEYLGGVRLGAGIWVWRGSHWLAGCGVGEHRVLGSEQVFNCSVAVTGGRGEQCRGEIRPYGGVRVLLLPKPPIGRGAAGLSPAAAGGSGGRRTAPSSVLSSANIYVYAGRRLAGTTFTQESSTNGAQQR